MLNVKLKEGRDLTLFAPLVVCRCVGQGEHRDSEGSEDNCYGDCRRRGLHGNESWWLMLEDSVSRRGSG